jgi:CRISPR-associated protein Cmr3
MVPAGSVYFFEVASGDPASLADQWLAPVSDDAQEQRDGFGLALWGTW